MHWIAYAGAGVPDPCAACIYIRTIPSLLAPGGVCCCHMACSAGCKTGDACCLTKCPQYHNPSVQNYAPTIKESCAVRLLTVATKVHNGTAETCCDAPAQLEDHTHPCERVHTAPPTALPSELQQTSSPHNQKHLSRIVIQPSSAPATKGCGWEPGGMKHPEAHCDDSIKASYNAAASIQPASHVYLINPCQPLVTARCAEGHLLAAATHRQLRAWGHNP